MIKPSKSFLPKKKKPSKSFIHLLLLRLILIDTSRLTSEDRKWLQEQASKKKDNRGQVKIDIQIPRIFFHWGLEGPLNRVDSPSSEIREWDSQLCLYVPGENQYERMHNTNKLNNIYMNWPRCVDQFWYLMQGIMSELFEEFKRKVQHCLRDLSLRNAKCN